MKPQILECVIVSNMIILLISFRNHTFDLEISLYSKLLTMIF